ncbi:MAG: hypothetical protein JJU11_16325 [Candidatus Sumerlaeia bacterium]|nr:hypothetical protein [Candidatus Sumerlaeia bacterium]
MPDGSTSPYRPLQEKGASSMTHSLNTMFTTLRIVMHAMLIGCLVYVAFIVLSASLGIAKLNSGPQVSDSTRIMVRYYVDTLGNVFWAALLILILEIRYLIGIRKGPEMRKQANERLLHWLTSFRALKSLRLNWCVPLLHSRKMFKFVRAIGWGVAIALIILLSLTLAWGLDQAVYSQPLPSVSIFNVGEWLAFFCLISFLAAIILGLTTLIDRTEDSMLAFIVASTVMIAYWAMFFPLVANHGLLPTN